MSIISNIQNELQGNQVEIIRAKTKADTIRNTTVAIYESMKEAFNQGSTMFWASEDATPEDIAAYLGTNASGIFYLHARLGEVLALVDPSGIAEGLSVVGEYTQNGDGSITIIQPSGE